MIVRKRRRWVWLGVLLGVLLLADGGFARPNVSRGGGASRGSVSRGGGSGGGARSDARGGQRDRQGSQRDRQGDRRDAQRDRRGDRREFRDDVRDERREFYEDRWRRRVGARVTIAAFRALTCEQRVIIVDGVVFYGCAGNWYRRQVQTGTVVYVVVTAPAGY